MAQQICTDNMSVQMEVWKPNNYNSDVWKCEGTMVQISVQLANQLEIQQSKAHG